MGGAPYMGGDGGDDREPQPSARGDRVKLPRADWQKRQGMVPLLRALGAAEGETRFVGGCVRDTLLGIDVSDIDLATRLEPGAVIERLKRSEEHTSELQSLMRTSYAVFCLKK